MSELDRTEPLIPSPESDKRWVIHTCFFLLGAGSCVTFNSIIMAVAYFKKYLGAGFLAKVAFAHNLPLLLVMGGLILGAKRNPPLWLYATSLRGAIAFSLCFVVSIFWKALKEESVSASVLLPLVAVNGAATGLIQSLGASLSGLFDPYSFARGAGSMQLSGASFGVFLPTLTQLALVPLEVRCTDRESSERLARIGALTSCLLATVVCFLAYWGVGILQASKVWCAVLSQAELNGSEPRPPMGSLACRNPSVDTIGKCFYTRSFAFVRTRVHLLRVVIVSQVVIEFSFVSLILYASHLHVKGGHFWEQFLATILLIVSNCGNFLGRIGGTTLGLGEKRGTDLFGKVGRGVVLVVLVVAAPVPWAASRLYAQFLDQGVLHALEPTTVVLVFIVATVLSGLSLISLSQLSQSLCGYSMDTPCEITAQLVWLAVTVGALTGTVVSLLT